MTFKFVIASVFLSVFASEAFGAFCPCAPPSPCASVLPAPAPVCAPAPARGPAKAIMKTYKSVKAPVSIDMKVPSQIPIGKFCTCQKISLRPSIVPTQIVDEAALAPGAGPAPAPIIKYITLPAGCTLPGLAPVPAPLPVPAPGPDANLLQAFLLSASAPAAPACGCVAPSASY